MPLVINTPVELSTGIILQSLYAIYRYDINARHTTKPSSINVEYYVNKSACLAEKERLLNIIGLENTAFLVDPHPSMLNPEWVVELVRNHIATKLQIDINLVVYEE